ncbi:MAG: hypothetical protein HYT61_03405 [Candidatus Yanofskybacteria bacterium]|nr:hypothetical protein [Candidatus Yanofskybacteria bacterium]
MGWDITTGKFSCGDDDTSAGSGDAGFGIEAINAFTANGNWVKQAYVNQVYVEVWGGGAGGNNAAAINGGGGGGGGGYSAGITAVNGNVSIVVGTGGTVGVVGNLSRFTGALNGGANIQGNGGGLGLANGVGGVGGSAIGGTLNLSGSNGGSGFAAVAGAGGGDGGGSPMGGAGGGGGSGAGSAHNGNGTIGAAPGGAGGGGSANLGKGAAGAAGAVIVWALSGTNGSDLAEYFVVEDGVEPGDVVAVGPNDTSYDSKQGLQKTAVLKKATPEDRVVGVISTDPFQIMNKDLNDQRPSDTQPVALSGTALVKVSTANGEIKKGDLLTASDVPGVAVRTDKAGLIIGSALEDFDVSVASQSDGFPEDQGKILMFISTTYSTGARTKSVLGKYGVNMDEIPEDIDIGRLVLAQMLSHKQEITASTSLSEIYTDRIIAGLEIISPRVLTDTLVVNIIEPVDDDVGFKLANGGVFSIFNVASDSFSTSFGPSSLGRGTGPPVITFDSLGNAFFSGALKADSLTIGSRDRPNGITFYDTETGEPYCVRMTRGQLVHIPGECSVIPSILNNSQPEPTPIPSKDYESLATPESSIEPTSESEPSVSEESTAEPIIEESPPPEPTPSAEVEPQVEVQPPVEEPTPEPDSTSLPQATPEPPPSEESPLSETSPDT